MTCFVPVDPTGRGFHETVLFALVLLLAAAIPAAGQTLADELVMDNVGTMLDKGLVAPRVGIHMGGTRRMVEFDRTSTALGARSLSGRLVDNPDSMVVVSAKGEALSGVIWDGATRYEIDKGAGGHIEVRQADPVPIRGPDATVQPSVSSYPPSSRAQQTRDNGDDIDIFVYWTRETRIQGHSLDEISTEVVNLVEYVNQTFSDSGSDSQLNLVGSSEYDAGTITDLSSALADFTTAPQVTQVRSLYAADLMALVGIDAIETVTVDWAYTGWAFFGGRRNGRDGWSSITYLRDESVFAHEIGHNLGAVHDRYQEAKQQGGGNPRSLEGYHYGYVDVVGMRRTIMAYGTECSDEGLWCPRVSRFSTPLRRLDGRPLGVADSIDAVRSFGDEHNHVANHMQSDSRCRIRDIPDDVTLTIGGTATVEPYITGECSWGAYGEDEQLRLAVDTDRVTIHDNGLCADDGSKTSVVDIAGVPVTVGCIAPPMPTSVSQTPVALFGDEARLWLPALVSEGTSPIRQWNVTSNDESVATVRVEDGHLVVTPELATDGTAMVAVEAVDANGLSASVTLVVVVEFHWPRRTWRLVLESPLPTSTTTESKLPRSRLAPRSESAR